MHNIQPLPLQHLAEIPIPPRNSIPHRQLFRQQRLPVAYRHQLCTLKMLNHLSMPIGDLPAPNNPNPQLLQIRHP